MVADVEQRACVDFGMSVIGIFPWIACFVQVFFVADLVQPLEQQRLRGIAAASG